VQGKPQSISYLERNLSYQPFRRSSLRKVSHVLQALAKTVDASSQSPESPPIQYFALDLERRELIRTLNAVNETIGSELHGRVATKGMWGTYDGGIAFVQNGGLGQLENASDTSCNSESQKYLSDEPQRGRGAKRHTEPLEPLTARPSPVRQRSTSASTSSSLMTAESPISSVFPRQDSSSVPTEASSGSPVEHGRSRSPSPISHNTEPASGPLHMLFLGSSIGNFSRAEAAEFLKSLPLRQGSGDTLLLGVFIFLHSMFTDTKSML